jgi:hypothetical protein
MELEDLLTCEMAASMKMAVFWIIAPCSLVEVYHRQGDDGRLMMEAASTSEMSVNFYQTARRNNPEDSHLHQRVHKSPQLVPFLKQLNSVNIRSISLRSILIVSYQLRSGLPSGLFPPGFPTKMFNTSSLPCVRHVPALQSALF